MLDQVVPVLPKEFCTKIEQMPTKCPPFFEANADLLPTNHMWNVHFLNNKLQLSNKSA